MTTITKDIAAKLAVAVVAVAMVLAAFAPAAQAQTTEELQAMINDLLAQVAALQGQVGGSTGAGSSASASFCPYTWTRDLSNGSTGDDVMKLQQFLNSDPDTRVAMAGQVGSAGMETNYYGPATAAAVSKFQVKYRADILSPLGLVNPTGYYGAGSRDKANSLCSATLPTPSEDEDEMEDEDEEEDDEDFTLRGEASLDVFEIDDAEDNTLEEGAEDAPIAEFTVEFTNGDAEISRLDVRLVGGTLETDPWDVFETLQLWVDGDMIAEENADDEDDWLDEDDGEFRFSNLGLFAEEDEEVEIILAATLQSSLDISGSGETWDVSAEVMRFFDADGVATTEDNVGDLGGNTSAHDNTVDFTIEEEGYEDELIVKTSSSDPDSATLQVEDDSDSDWYTVFVFDLDTDDSINDIELNSVPVTVTLSTSSLADVIDDAELVIDGETIDDYSVVYSTTTNPGDTGVFTFDVDGDVVIDAGDRVQAELMLRFNSLDLGNEGVTVEGSVTGANADAIDAEGADDLTNTGTDQLRGAATGEPHTLRTAGLDVSPESTSAVLTTVDGLTNDYVDFEVEVEITAFEQDVFIAVDPDVSISYDLVDGSGNVIIGSGATTTILSSSADEDGTGNYYEINEGQTETLTLQVTYQPGAAQSARLRLNSISFNDAASAPTQNQTTLPQSDYRTAVVTIVD